MCGSIAPGLLHHLLVHIRDVKTRQQAEVAGRKVDYATTGTVAIPTPWWVDVDV